MIHLTRHQPSCPISENHGQEGYNPSIFKSSIHVLFLHSFTNDNRTLIGLCTLSFVFPNAPNITDISAPNLLKLCPACRTGHLIQSNSPYISKSGKIEFLLGLTKMAISPLIIVRNFKFGNSGQQGRPAVRLDPIIVSQNLFLSTSDGMAGIIWNTDDIILSRPTPS